MNVTKLEKWISETERLHPLTHQALDALQLERLCGLLRRERARFGFYKDVPERIESLAELRRLPFTTAADLVSHGGAMTLTSQSRVERVITGVTSGTTGEAKRVFYTAADCENTVGFFAAGISEMTGAGGAVLIAMPFSGPNGLGDLISRAVESLGARPIRAGAGLTYGEIAEALEREKPDGYIGMPAPLLSLLRYVGPGSLRRALISADACPPGVTEAAERMLGTRLFPHYGSRETALGGAVTCPAHQGMHLRENHIIAEIVSPSGEVLSDGDWGELTLTTIGMEAMPLIRYRTGDRARILPGDCPCGGVTKRIEVTGRLGGGISMAALDDALFRVPELIDCRAEISGAGLEIRALTLSDCAGALRSAAEAASGLAASVTERRPAPGDRSMYAGKRYILPQKSF